MVIKLKYYLEKNLKIFKFEGKNHKKIILYNGNYRNHIKLNHPEISLKKIKEILQDPDYIYKASRNSRTNYYEKDYKNDTYRVVIKKSKKNGTQVVTAYKVGNKHGFTRKHIHCTYDKRDTIRYENMLEKLWDEQDYFYELFKIAE